MAGRAFAFADPGIIKLATEEFVAVCADDWYQRRRKDAEGEFFRKMADQGPRKGTGGSTRQGIYTFTADGDLLEFKNAGQDAKATREQLDRALKKWAALPAKRREPGAVTVPDHGKLDANYSRTPPKDGLIVRVNSRILDKQGDDYIRGTCEFTGGMKAARDFLWLTADDVKALNALPKKVDDVSSLPDAIVRRMARFHMVDNTRGEPNFWKSAELKTNPVSVSVSKSDADGVEYQVAGIVILGTKKGDRGYEARLNGVIRIKDGKVTRFDLAAVGDHWGDDSGTQSGCRPGRTPFGVAFGLADATKPAERVSPQAARDLGLYLGQRED
ncbi:hypothetical protein BH11PLA2_BH11PLA2_12900 [soil metagenome]